MIETYLEVSMVLFSSSVICVLFVKECVITVEEIKCSSKQFKMRFLLHFIPPFIKVDDIVVCGTMYKLKTFLHVFCFLNQWLKLKSTLLGHFSCGRTSFFLSWYSNRRCNETKLESSVRSPFNPPKLINLLMPKLLTGASASFSAVHASSKSQLGFSLQFERNITSWLCKWNSFDQRSNLRQSW